MKQKAIKVFIHLLPTGRKLGVRGYLPFTVFGERFAVTRKQSIEPLWVATHVATGVAVPRVALKKRKDVPAAATEEIHNVGRKRFLVALAAVHEITRCAAASAQDGKKEERTP